MNTINTYQKTPTSIVGASLWMLLIALLLCWIPPIGPFVAGLVGGRKAGDVSCAIIAALLPAALLALAAFMLVGILSCIPLIGLLAGMGTLILALANVSPILLGAIIGALLD